MGDWERAGHVCRIIRHNGSAHNELTQEERDEMKFDLYAECCQQVTRRKPHRTAKAVETSILQPQGQRVTREMLEGLGFV